MEFNSEVLETFFICPYCQFPENGKALGNIKNHLKTVQMLASGVAPKDAIQWDSPSYKVAGYHQDPETGDVFFAPDGPSGTVYILRDGKFVNAGL